MLFVLTKNTSGSKQYTLYYIPIILLNLLKICGYDLSIAYHVRMFVFAFVLVDLRRFLRNSQIKTVLKMRLLQNGNVIHCQVTIKIIAIKKVIFVYCMIEKVANYITST